MLPARCCALLPEEENIDRYLPPGPGLHVAAAVDRRDRQTDVVPLHRRSLPEASVNNQLVDYAACG